MWTLNYVDLKIGLTPVELPPWWGKLFSIKADRNAYQRWAPKQGVTLSKCSAFYGEHSKMDVLYIQVGESHRYVQHTRESEATISDTLVVIPDEDVVHYLWVEPVAQEVNPFLEEGEIQSFLNIFEDLAVPPVTKPVGSSPQVVHNGAPSKGSRRTSKVPASSK